MSDMIYRFNSRALYNINETFSMSFLHVNSISALGLACVIILRVQQLNCYTSISSQCTGRYNIVHQICKQDVRVVLPDQSTMI